MNLDHLSNSQINTLSKCGEQYRRRYIEGEKLPPGFAQLRGKGTHHTNEANLKAKLEAGEFLSPEEIKSLASDFVDSALQGEVILDGEYQELGLAAAKGRLKDEVIGLSGLHASQVAPTIEPTAIEVRVELKPSETLPVTFVGVIDLIDRGVRIRDTKTKTKSPSSDEAQNSEQLTAYHLLFLARYGMAPESLGLDFLIRTAKKGDLKVVQQTTTRTREDLETFVRRAQAALHMIQREVFIPAPVDSWACSERFCGYWHTCPFAARGRARPQS